MSIFLPALAQLINRNKTIHRIKLTPHAILPTNILRRVTRRWSRRCLARVRLTSINFEDGIAVTAQGQQAGIHVIIVTFLYKDSYTGPLFPQSRNFTLLLVPRVVDDRFSARGKLKQIQSPWLQVINIWPTIYAMRIE